MSSTPEPARAETLDTRELDRQIAERLGYRHNGDLWEYDTPYGFPAVVEDFPHYSTDANTLLPLLAEWLNDSDIDLHTGSLDALGSTGILYALLRGEYEKLARAWIVWRDARKALAAPRPGDGDPAGGG